MSQRSEPPFKDATRIIISKSDVITTDLWLGEMYRHNDTPATLVVVTVDSRKPNTRSEKYLHLTAEHRDQLIQALQASIK